MCKSVFSLIKTSNPFNWDCKFQTALDIRRRCSAGVFPSFQPYIPNALVPICVPMGKFSSHLKTRCGRAHCWHTAFPEAEENASTIYQKILVWSQWHSVFYSMRCTYEDFRTHLHSACYTMVHRCTLNVHKSLHDSLFLIGPLLP